jgi:hypothetical protein
VLTEEYRTAVSIKFKEISIWKVKILVLFNICWNKNVAYETIELASNIAFSHEPEPCACALVIIQSIQQW